MNIGDLVTYKAGMSFPPRHVVKRIGIVVDVDRHALTGVPTGRMVEVAWGDYGTFWDPIANLEILK
jgi:hypothetical protein